MDWNQIEGGWKRLKGSAKQQWAKLTDDDLEMIEGKRDVLAGKLQQRYGIAREEAERQIHAWSEEFGTTA